ncbi:coniferyl-alcohol dehydrogenase [Burkholderia glumae]|uniref:Coniferyl-alcohol dehydrogenase n=1 Tax=Burkholderia glumae TaxID=337 RepID=A0AAP9XYN8_BURGL|nr:coniferyl-alcohol dehydrogenase [Burkholderia glumae]ACR31091.1 Short-chain dehydrogenase/reductase SDR [Burkholderia glumae BGR1]AJY64266.1 short chain dehydrogenase family protein [Burkholderia glumae LMG 2196 = ATCC 33617]KHJ60943.1 3-alpha-hydroxysteroid dehydrogenase [Burkholderia glumae]MCM2483585.1 coniferyl-alcohol dehydrogenase [Burkholderia glumae]MCM2493939.1 coniferyl-alcohol dehydrogenase [Burkholderia glumae]
MNLYGKTLIVTGVASGIGAETARLARFHGARVIGVDRQLVNMTLDGFCQADLGDPAAIDALVAQLPERIDALANIAGVPGTAPVDAVARVNYLGLRHLSEALLPRIAAGGSVINVASILGAEWPQRLDLHRELAETAGFDGGAQWLAAHPVPQATCYQYFKEALIVWSARRSQDWFAQHSVRVNSVAPGPVFTPILGDFVTMLGPERVEADAAKMKRPAYADEVAEAIVFLASDAARWINGVNLPVDGGLAATAI